MTLLTLASGVVVGFFLGFFYVYWRDQREPDEALKRAYPYLRPDEREAIRKALDNLRKKKFND